MMNTMGGQLSHNPQGYSADTADKSLRWWRRWPAWVAYAAAAWSLMYGALGLFWTFGGAGFPFGVNDARAMAGETMSMLVGITPEVTAPIIAFLGLSGAVVALAMVQSWGKRISRSIPVTFGAFMCIILLFVIPDIRLLQNFAYAFMLYYGLVDWQVWNQVICVIGGLLWGASLLSYRRKINHACSNCGRKPGIDHTTRMAIAMKWCKRLAWIAIIAALPYGLTRFAWNFGIPLGYPIEGLFEGFGLSYDGIRYYHLPWQAWVLVALDFTGAILMHGLISRWGEIYPRWFPFKAGKRVHPLTAVIPAMIISILITIAGVGMWFYTIQAIVNGSFDNQDFLANWGASGPGFLFIFWGVGLAGASIAYYYRRRDRCLHCGEL
ncbi:hypothetical protein ACFOLF_00055 [Paenibacillus sepulcri]|uniref:DUF3995 domain-containing protein n=1 Tax=Paenibacillus sepulcri TaxID=359917 RepID=A0ABS7C0G7_9BACL|nr:hypothetical protein [Paenibacillus sepulcri]